MWPWLPGTRAGPGTPGLCAGNADTDFGLDTASLPAAGEGVLTALNSCASTPSLGHLALSGPGHRQARSQADRQPGQLQGTGRCSPMGSVTALGQTLASPRKSLQNVAGRALMLSITLDLCKGLGWLRCLWGPEGGGITARALEENNYEEGSRQSSPHAFLQP